MPDTHPRGHSIQQTLSLDLQSIRLATGWQQGPFPLHIPEARAASPGAGTAKRASTGHSARFTCRPTSKSAPVDVSKHHLGCGDFSVVEEQAPGPIYTQSLSPLPCSRSPGLSTEVSSLPQLQLLCYFSLHQLSSSLSDHFKQFFSFITFCFHSRNEFFGGDFLFSS